MREISLAEKAADWWVNALKNPKFDNGDKSDTGFMCQMLASMSNKGDKYSQEQLDKFKTKLIEIIKREQTKPYGDRFILSVDYNPDLYLAEALEAADLPDNTMVLPWKTVMWIRPDSVKVAYGYRAAPVEL